MTNYIQANQYWQLPEAAEYRWVLANDSSICFENESHEEFLILVYKKTIYKVRLCDDNTFEFFDGRPIDLKNEIEKKFYEKGLSNAKRLRRTNCNVQ